MKRIAYLRFIAMLGCLLGSFLALAQGVDVEPNNACTEAQDMEPETTVEGSLDTPPETADIDFFKFSSPPKTLIEVYYAGDRPLDPLLGVFDANCNLLNYNDDINDYDYNSSLQFVVPADGAFILAATSYGDEVFSGAGNSSGSYLITLTTLLPGESISGRVIDELTGAPLAGDDFPYAYVELHHCNDDDCFDYYYVNSTYPSSDGRFAFKQDLSAGTYQIVANAQGGYTPGQTDPFDVGEGESLDVGDISLLPPPIELSELPPCDTPVPSEGGKCRYSVEITNNSLTPFEGKIWSLIHAYGLGSPVDATYFVKPGQPGKQKIELASGETKMVPFKFGVLGTVSDNAWICYQVFVGQFPNAYFNLVAQTEQFCFYKESPIN